MSDLSNKKIIWNDRIQESPVAPCLLRQCDSTASLLQYGGVIETQNDKIRPSNKLYIPAATGAARRVSISSDS